MVEATTKLHKVQTEDNSIMPEEATSKDSLLKEIQHHIVPVSRDKLDNVMSLSRHSLAVNETSFRCPTSGGNQSRVVPTYHQDEDDKDAQHKAIQDDNPIITELIHVEYSLDDISKTETPIVIQEDEMLMVEATTKLHKVQMEDNNIMPAEATSKDSLLKEIQHQIVPVSRDK
ncbi:hypothetical protein Tco_0210534 [Tanacetum coccineum]